MAAPAQREYASAPEPLAQVTGWRAMPGAAFHRSSSRTSPGTRRSMTPKISPLPALRKRANWALVTSNLSMKKEGTSTSSGSSVATLPW
jgi:hypothetical protein